MAYLVGAVIVLLLIGSVLFLVTADKMGEGKKALILVGGAVVTVAILAALFGVFYDPSV